MAPSGGTTFGTYHLSVSVRPAATPPGTTYTSTVVPVAIPTGPGVVTSTLVIPDDIRIGQLKVAVDLTHNFMSDLDVTLTSPDGNTVALFTDVGSTTAGAQTRMNMMLDDNAATSDRSVHHRLRSGFQAGTENPPGMVQGPAGARDLDADHPGRRH